MNKFYSLIFLSLLLLTSFVSSQGINVEEQIKNSLPNLNVDKGINIVLIFILVLVIIAIFGIGLYFFIQRLKFNQIVLILEDVTGSNDLEVVGRDKGMRVKVGKGGTELLYLRKRKSYKGSYGKRMGKNTYYFGIGSDGYWYNVTLGSLDLGMKKIGIKPTNVNMRYQNESLINTIDERYNDKNFWDKYGQIIMNLIFFMLIAVMFWLYFDTFKEVAPTLTQATATLKETAQILKETIGGIDTLRGTGGFTT